MKNLLKKILKMFALIFVLPFYGAMLLGEFILKNDQSFQGFSHLLSLFSRDSRKLPAATVLLFDSLPVL